MNARAEAAPDLEIHPLAGALGAEIGGVDLGATLSDALVSKIRTPWSNIR